MQELHDLTVLLRSSIPIIVVETHEEQRVVDAFLSLSMGGTYKPLYKWTVTEGLRRIDIEAGAQRHNAQPAELLGQIKATELGGTYVLLDFHPFLDEPVHVRLLKDIATNAHRQKHTLVLVSHQITLPPELEPYTARFEFSVPTRETLQELVQEEAKQFQRDNPGKAISTDRKTFEQLLNNLAGLNVDDARRLARGAIRDDGALTRSDLPEVMKAKFELLNTAGVLSYAYDTAQFADVGGLSRLKEWLALRKDVFIGEKSLPGLDPPKGVMLLGVQGCGKSLAAKAVAGAWGVPLLQLDFGTLYNKFHGETERNLRESLKTANLMEPAVLWIDEIEKGIGSDGMDGGTSKRVLGTLLTWLAENKSRTFIVATANDIEALPPELLRKGRLDEIFFVDLPDHNTRPIIFEIHLRRRQLDPGKFNLQQLADATEGFSGSEIEQIVVSGLYSAHAQSSKLGTAHLLQEVSRTSPLSVVMAEKVERLRDWAQARTVPAN